IWLGKASAAVAMSEIEVPDRPCSLNRRLAPSSSRERISRPAERVARAACLGSPDGISAVWTDFRAILPSFVIFVWHTNKDVNGPFSDTCQPLLNSKPQSPHQCLPAP